MHNFATSNPNERFKQCLAFRRSPTPLICHHFRHMTRPTVFPIRFRPMDLPLDQVYRGNFRPKHRMILGNLHMGAKNPSLCPSLCSTIRQKVMSWLTTQMEEAMKAMAAVRMKGTGEMLDPTRDFASSVC